MKKKILAMLLCLSMAMQMTNFVGADEEYVEDILSNEIVVEEADEAEPELDEPIFDVYEEPAPDESEEEPPADGEMIEEIVEIEEPVEEETPAEEADEEEIVIGEIIEEEPSEEETEEPAEEIVEIEIIEEEEIILDFTLEQEAGVFGSDGGEEEILMEEMQPEDSASYVQPSNFISVAGLSVSSQQLMTAASDTENTTDTFEEKEYIVTTKTIDYTDEGYTLTLESYIKAQTTKANIPVDIVLVLDQSGSMRNCYEHDGASNCTKCRLAKMVINDCWDSDPSTANNRTHLWKICDWSYDTVSKTNKYEYYYTYDSKGNIKCDKNGNPIENPIYYNYYDNNGKVGLTARPDDGGEKNITTDKQYYFWNPVAKNGYQDVYLVEFCSICTEWVKVGKHTKGENGSSCSGGRLDLKEGTDRNDTADYVGWFLKYDPENAPNAVPRRDALRKAVNGFLTQVQEDSIKRGVTNNVAIVGFAAENTNTEILQAMQPLSTADDLNVLETAMENLDAEGITRTDLGMKEAADILDSVKNNGHNKVVIVFTDGEPTTERTPDDPSDDVTVKDGQSDEYLISYFNKDTANRALAEAKKIKADATIYTIGIFSGANGDRSDFPKDYTDYEPKVYYENRTNEVYKQARIDATNRFCHLLSSNYLSAKSMTEIGTENSSLEATDAGYFLSPKDYATLVAAFAQIATNLQTDASLVALDASTTVKDTIAEGFVVDTGREVSVSSASYTGENEWTADTTIEYTPTISDDGKTVTVTGFNFYGNPVGVKKITDANGNVTQTTYTGKKLVITIPIAESENKGGTKMPTNDLYSSGIFKGDLCYENFKLPSVDIPTDITVKKTVHGGKKTEFNFTVSGVQWNGTYSNAPQDKLDETDSNYLTINTDSTNELTVNTKEYSNPLKISAGNSGKIEDIVVGSTINIKELDNELYDVVVKVDGQPHNAESDGSYEITVTPGMVIEFINTIKHTSLTVTKVIPKAVYEIYSDVDRHQSFLFKVQKGTELPIEVVINMDELTVTDNGDYAKSVIINGLLVGDTYTVTEDTNWSSRYETEENLTTIELKISGNKVNITNTRNTIPWIDGFTQCRNLFTGTTDNENNNPKHYKDQD